MNENKKILVILGVLVLFVGLVVLALVFSEKKTVNEGEINEIGITEYSKLLASSEKSVIILGSSSCPYAQEARKTAIEIISEYGIEIHYFDLSKMAAGDNEKLMDSLEYLREEQWGTPLMLIVANGELVEALGGFAGKEGYIAFLKEQGII